MKKVIVGLSGGVDSAVSCLLLKQQGYDVEAVFMQNWDSYINNENYYNNSEKCDSQYEWEDAKKIADVIGIKIHKVDFIKEYWENVFKEFIEEYKKGRTPNPDVLCNKYIKFGYFLKYAQENFECDYVATGHYAKVIHYESHSELHMCKDKNKDQTYFLCELSQNQLSKILFPLENLNKSEVREIAKDNNLPVWNKKDSTGICFIGKRDFRTFLSNYIENQEGNIIDIVTNKIIGKHHGVMYYTIGQNDGLGLGGQVSRYYVCKKDTISKILYVVDEKNKLDYLVSHRCVINNFNWINNISNFDNLKIRFRHRQDLINCSITSENGKIIVDYQEGSLAVTEGQYGVLYQETNCLGGGQVDLIIKIY